MRTVVGLLSQKIYLSAVGVALVAVVFSVYLVTSVLDTPITDQPKQVTVQLASTGGLFEGSAVTYRGVKIGKVTDIRLTPAGVEATASLVTTEDIPTDSVVKVRSLSPVGEQYLDFQPNSDSGPFLQDGAVIPAEATELPQTLAETVVNVKALLDQIDADHLQSALTEVNAGLNGTGDDLATLIDQGDALLADLENSWPTVESLLANGNTVLKIAPSERGSIAELARSSRLFAAFLKNYDPRFEQLLADAPTQLQQLEELLQSADELLPTLLDRSITLNDLLAAREPHVRELLAQYPRGINAFASSFRDGEWQVIALLQSQRVCDYGTDRREARDPVRHEFQTGGHCAASFNGLVRGAAHTPAPLW